MNWRSHRPDCDRHALRSERRYGELAGKSVQFFRDIREGKQVEGVRDRPSLHAGAEARYVSQHLAERQARPPAGFQQRFESRDVRQPNCRRESRYSAAQAHLIHEVPKAGILHLPECTHWMLAHEHQPLVELRVVRDSHTTLAGGQELAAPETENGYVTAAAELLSSVRRAERLSGVEDERYAVSARDL